MSGPEGRCRHGASERSRKLVEPALEHLVRLEAYFRLNGLSELSEKTEAVLLEAERLLIRETTAGPASAEEPEGEGVEESTPPFTNAPSNRAYG